MGKLKQVLIFPYAMYLMERFPFELAPWLLIYLILGLKSERLSEKWDLLMSYGPLIFAFIIKQQIV